ncbi:MAG: dihydrofolate reductase family protein [Aeromicrobium sp.]
MSVRYYTATTMDGFIADSDNSLDWLLQHGDGSGDFYERFLSGIGAVVMGSTTYQWVLDNDPGPWPYAMPSFVFTSRGLPAVEGGDIRFVHGSVADRFAEVVEAAGGRDVWVVGGGDLAGQFHDAGHLDEVILAVAPVALGAGAPVLPRRITDGLTLTSATVDGPFAMLHYRVG